MIYMHRCMWPSDRSLLPKLQYHILKCDKQQQGKKGYVNQLKIALFMFHYKQRILSWASWLWCSSGNLHQLLNTSNTDDPPSPIVRHDKTNSFSEWNHKYLQRDGTKGMIKTDTVTDYHSDTRATYHCRWIGRAESCRSVSLPAPPRCQLHRLHPLSRLLADPETGQLAFNVFDCT